MPNALEFILFSVCDCDNIARKLIKYLSVAYEEEGRSFKCFFTFATDCTLSINQPDYIQQDN